MIRCPCFVVTRVQGKTAGGGIGLVAASDYALAARSAHQALRAGRGHRTVRGRAGHREEVGLAAFSALAVDADWRSAEWAHRVGLYSELLDTPPALDYRVEEFARKLAAYNPEAVRKLKETFWGGTEGLGQLLEARAEISGTLVLGEYTRKALGGK